MLDRFKIESLISKRAAKHTREAKVITPRTYFQKIKN